MDHAKTELPLHEMLLQLATDRQVHSFDLQETFRVSIGRHHTNDIQLRSNRVSNYHVEILNEAGELLIRDMGSTNGTYVNDESVRRQRLESGDRIRIGSFLLSVTLVPRQRKTKLASPFRIGTVGNILPYQSAVSVTQLTMSPERIDTTLPDLLIQLASHGMTAMIVIRNQSGDGRLYLTDGQIVHCQAGNVRKEKALHRVLGIQKGRYEIFAFPTDATVPMTIAGQTEIIILEAMQQIEALERLTSKLPPLVYEIGLNDACDVAVNALSADELEIYEYLIRYQTIVRVMEESELTDFQVLRHIHSLLARGFFRTTKASDGLLEETSFSRPEVS
ncbi:MAG: FHA domain-containing protein [Acidobacteria bacterium]|nr:MAG: FHA domain-containing protein [Acidobacteriota bacterium]